VGSRGAAYSYEAPRGLFFLALLRRTRSDLLFRPQCGPLEALVALGDILPVHPIPESIEELRLLIQILQIPRVLPRVEYQQRQASLRTLRLVIVQLRGEQPSRYRIQHQRAPAGSHAGGRGFGELLLELVEAAEIPIERAGEISAGLAAALGRQI